MFRAFFQEEQDIGDVDVLTRLAVEVGLGRDAYRQALVNRTYRETHRQALRHAVEEIGITSVPTFVIGQRVLPGLQNQRSLEQAIEAAENLG